MALGPQVVDLVGSQTIEGVDWRGRVREVPIVEMEVRLAKVGVAAQVVDAPGREGA